MAKYGRFFLYIFVQTNQCLLVVIIPVFTLIKLINENNSPCIQKTLARTVSANKTFAFVFFVSSSKVTVHCFDCFYFHKRVEIGATPTTPPLSPASSHSTQLGLVSDQSEHRTVDL